MTSNIEMITGPFIEVLKHYGLSDDQLVVLTGNSGADKNKISIKKDTVRTSVIDFAGTFDEFREDCENDDVYKEPYTQGYLDGSFVKLLYMQRKPADIPLSDWSSDMVSLSFAYKDDNNQWCGFCLVYKKKSPTNWALQIFNNTTLPMTQKNASLFTHGALRESPQNSNLDATQLKQAIKTALGAEKVNLLVSDLFDDSGEINLAAFNALNPRLNKGRNIDNRDNKQRLLEELLQTLPKNDRFNETIKSYQHHADSEINFFKDDVFEKHLNDLVRASYERFEDLEKQNKDQDLFFLTLQAIRLELKFYSSYDETGKDRHYKYLREAKLIRELINTPNLSANELIKEYATVVQTHERNKWFITKPEAPAASKAGNVISRNPTESVIAGLCLLAMTICIAFLFSGLLTLPGLILVSITGGATLAIGGIDLRKIIHDETVLSNDLASTLKTQKDREVFIELAEKDFDTKLSVLNNKVNVFLADNQQADASKTAIKKPSEPDNLFKNPWETKELPSIDDAKEDDKILRY